eukprot:TRINITY_DN859_c0_g1_i1.p1 TRINITY_DN859_c0_g1~~TRINITY_DN859_c0_g1_i1.p1  ORF type:complete len:266 (+),score=14.43 TRINITY_DN859_c0_g1_i1:94-891(+)
MKTKNSQVVIRKRASEERGHADHGWLNTYHTFSFANYNEPKYSSFHSLRVINEDRVTAGNGFGRHGHQEFEIFSYVVSGALSHQDSMGNREVISRGDVQFTTAGTGITHSESNHSTTDAVHFIQIWVKPDTAQLKPSYQTMSFPDSVKKNKLALIVSPITQKSKTSISIHQDINVFASILDTAHESLTHNLQSGRSVYIHIIDTCGKNSGLELNTTQSAESLSGGDGAFIEMAGSPAPGTDRIQITAFGSNPVEFLLFDIKNVDF